MAEIIKHRPAYAPFECGHCGYIWYGGMGDHHYAPDVNLCDSCWNTLDNLLYRKNALPALTQQEHDEAQRTASAWLANTEPRPVTRRFHQSVPKWLRSAIDTGMVQTNSNK